jgi:SAM-dependent methyltransferase
MGREIDLLADYPRTKRDVRERGDSKTDQDREIARQFGPDFFDGDRRHGYGGFAYNSRFWEPVVPTFESHYGLTASSTLLDVGCAKGFMLYDFSRLIPGIRVKGVDISQYAIDNALDDMKDNLQVGNALSLPYLDSSFDVVISINTVHNLGRQDCIRALAEIERVSGGNSFITVDAYRTDDEKEAMFAWNLTAQTILHVDEWRSLFCEAGYTGDYYWFVP